MSEEMMPEELYKKAFEAWGPKAQLNMLIEAITELIKRNRNVNGSDNWDILEELVDVEIMLEQAKMIYGDKYWESIKQDKLIRLRKRLEAQE